jgi:hypothetical protein
VNLPRVVFSAKKVGVIERKLRRKGGEIHGEDGGACVIMQGTFQRVRMNVLEMPAREMNRFNSPGKLWLSNNSKDFQQALPRVECCTACVRMQSIQDDVVLEAIVKQCLHQNVNASVVTS